MDENEKKMFDDTDKIKIIISLINLRNGAACHFDIKCQMYCERTIMIWLDIFKFIITRYVLI